MIEIDRKNDFLRLIIDKDLTSDFVEYANEIIYQLDVEYDVEIDKIYYKNQALFILDISNCEKRNKEILKRLQNELKQKGLI